MNFSKILNLFGIIFLTVFLFASGYYVGFKNSYSNDYSAIEVVSGTDISSSTFSSASSFDIDSNIYWIKLGEKPICPETHLVKGKFKSDVNVYYTTDSKSYNRVTPHVCISNEKFASDIAGFLKKY